MCGRYGYTNKDQENVKKRFRLKRIDPDLVPRYNIAPGTDVPVVLNESPQILTAARWGLVPFWAKDEKIGYKMINARSEAIFEKPSFRNAITKRRCLIPADFFFEWKKRDGAKQPYCIRLKSRDTFALAGIWDCWRDTLISCSIITCAPNAMMADIHNRMPVILDEKDEEAWLADRDVKALMKPFDPGKMEAYPVSTLVNSPKNSSPEVLEELLD